MSDARHIGLTNEGYHRDKTAISFTGVKEILRDPTVFFAKRLDPNRKPADDDTEALAFGRSMHEAVCRPGLFGADFRIIPAEVLTSNGAKAGRAWQQFKAENADKVLLKPGETAQLMLDKLASHKVARELLDAAGDCEHSIFWHDDEFDVERKCRFDKVLPGRRLIIDYKTTEKSASPEECVKVVCDAKYRYDAQMEFYRDGAQEMYGERFEFVFIFQSKSFPYRVEAIHLDEKFSRIGAATVRRGLTRYAECLKSGVWLPETHGQLIDVSPPSYHERSEEWEFTSNG